MSFVEDIIARAFREAQIVPLAGSATDAENDEALALLNSIILSVAGHEAGVELTDLPVGGELDQSWRLTDGVPDDTRLVFNLTAARTIYLDPTPYEGQRFAVVDAGANFDTYKLTIDPNGRMIEVEPSLDLEVNGTALQWMYRADTANWVRLTELATTDDMPFPPEFDDYFVIMLAMRLNPRHRIGEAFPGESVAYLQRQEAAMQARYRKPRPQQDWGSLGLLGQCDTRLGAWNPLL